MFGYMVLEDPIDGRCPQCNEVIQLDATEATTDSKFLTWACPECNTLLSVTKK